MGTYIPRATLQILTFFSHVECRSVLDRTAKMAGDEATASGTIKQVPGGGWNLSLVRLA